MSAIEIQHIANKYGENFTLKVKSNLTNEKEIQSLKTYLLNIESLSLLSISANDIRKKIMAWHMVKNASVKIILPNTVFVFITKRKPCAVYWDYNNFFLVDDEGVVLNNDVSITDKKNFMLIVGDDGINNLKSIMNVITEMRGHHKVASVRFIGKRRWDVILENGTILKLPENNPGKALRLFDSLCKLKVNILKDHSVIDMRLAPEKIFIKK